MRTFLSRFLQLGRAIIEDTRQQAGKHKIKQLFFELAGIIVIRCALPVGDYQLAPKASVDTKKDICELAMDLKKDHARFRRECELAQTIGTQLYVLTENEDGVTCLADLFEWVEPDASFNVRNRKGKAVRYTGASMAKTCISLNDKYGVRFGFCTPEQAGEKIVELLLSAEGGE